MCSACKHHLRFDDATATAQRVAETIVPLRVQGTVRHPPDGGPWEYTVVLSIKNDRGDEIARHVVGVEMAGHHLQTPIEGGFVDPHGVCSPLEVTDAHRSHALHGVGDRLQLLSAVDPAVDLRHGHAHVSSRSRSVIERRS